MRMKGESFDTNATFISRLNEEKAKENVFHIKIYVERVRRLYFLAYNYPCD